MARVARVDRVDRFCAIGFRVRPFECRIMSGGESNCDGEKGTPSSPGSPSAGAGDDDGLMGMGTIGVWVDVRDGPRTRGGDVMVENRGGGDKKPPFRFRNSGPGFPGVANTPVVAVVVVVDDEGMGTVLRASRGGLHGVWIIIDEVAIPPCASSLGSTPMPTTTEPGYPSPPPFVGEDDEGGPPDEDDDDDDVVDELDMLV